MDVSLTSLKTSFEDVAYQDKMRAFKLFMFFLVTPADSVEFKSLLQGFDDLHYLTGEDVLIVAPSIKAVGGQLSRKDLVTGLEAHLNGTHDTETYATFKAKQTEETYDFARYIGLPFDALPCLAIFDRLISPGEFVTVPFGSRNDLQLAQQLRQILTHLEGRCLWSTARRIDDLQRDLSKRIPGAISRNKSLLQGISNDESALKSLLKRTQSLETLPARASDDYFASLGRLATRLNEFIASTENGNTSPSAIVEMLWRFQSCTYDSLAFEWLRRFRSENRLRIPKELFQSIHEFFQVASIFYRKERLAVATSHFQHSLNEKMKSLENDVHQERHKLLEELEQRRVEMALAAVPPLSALSEIGGARRFEFARHGQYRNGDWMLKASDMQTQRAVRPEEVSVVKSLKPIIVDGRLDNTQIDVVVLTAVRVELDSVLREITPRVGFPHIVRATDTPRRRIYYLGRLGNSNVAVTMCRMGSVGRAASLMTTYKSIIAWKPKYVIMVGIAFGRDNVKQQYGDVLVSSMIHCYELQRQGADCIIHRGPSPESGEMLLEMFHNVQGWSFVLPSGKEAKYRIGPILSGEKLIDNMQFKQALFDKYSDAIGGEMEAAGVYAAASTEAIEWIVVKGICDWADGTKGDDHQQVAAEAAVSLVKKVLSQAVE